MDKKIPQNILERCPYESSNMGERRKKLIKNFLRREGFQRFAPTGKYFVDDSGRIYGEGLTVSFKKMEGSQEVTYETSIRNICPHKDLFSVVCEEEHDESMRKITRIYFSDDKTPSRGSYNGYVHLGEVSWRVGEEEGGFVRSISPIIMLKTEISLEKERPLDKKRKN